MVQCNSHRPVNRLWIRRRYLVATVGLAALGGCTGGDGGGADGEDSTEPPTDDEGEEEEGEELPDPVSEDEFESGPVPDVYVSAASIGGERRNPDELHAKADVQFAEYDEAVENPAHQPGRSCGNCHECIADKNGDGFGACVAAEGYIGRGRLVYRPGRTAGAAGSGWDVGGRLGNRRRCESLPNRRVPGR